MYEFYIFEAPGRVCYCITLCHFTFVRIHALDLFNIFPIPYYPVPTRTSTTLSAHPRAYLHTRMHAFPHRYNLGVARMDQCQLDEAFLCYRMAISFDEKCCEAYNNLGVIYKDRGNLEKAIHYYSLGIKANPRFFQTLNNLGVIYTMLSDMDKAFSHCLRAIKCNPNYAEAYNNLGGLYRDEGRIIEALDAYNHAVTKNPDLLNAAHNRLLAMESLDPCMLQEERQRLSDRKEGVCEWTGSSEVAEDDIRLTYLHANEERCGAKVDSDPVNVEVKGRGKGDNKVMARNGDWERGAESGEKKGRKRRNKGGSTILEMRAATDRDNKENEGGANNCNNMENRNSVNDDDKSGCEEEAKGGRGEIECNKSKSNDKKCTSRNNTHNHKTNNNNNNNVENETSSSGGGRGSSECDVTMKAASLLHPRVIRLAEPSVVDQRTVADRLWEAHRSWGQAYMRRFANDFKTVQTALAGYQPSLGPAIPVQPRVAHAVNSTAVPVSIGVTPVPPPYIPAQVAMQMPVQVPMSMPLPMSMPMPMVVPTPVPVSMPMPMPLPVASAPPLSVLPAPMLSTMSSVTPPFIPPDVSSVASLSQISQISQIQNHTLGNHAISSTLNNPLVSTLAVNNAIHPHIQTHAHTHANALAFALKRPLRIGYLSADFCTHSVSYFIHAPLKHHTKNPHFTSHPVEVCTSVYIRKS